MFGPTMLESPFARGKARKSPRQRKPQQDREHAEAVSLMRWVRLHEVRWPALRWFAAVPNGGARSKVAGAKLKAEGVRPGVPDYLWPQRSGAYVGLALELKAKGGRVDPAQREWLAHLEAQGWRCVVAHGADEAWAAIREYCFGVSAV
jgi:VRR-NUC domain